MKYCNVYWLFKTTAFGISILIAIVQSNKVVISSQRVRYLAEGQRMTGTLISNAVARSRMECTHR